MAQNLTTIEPLKLPDLARPDRMPSLPAWVGSRIASVSEAMQKDASGNYKMMVVLPLGMTLGSSERKQIAGYAAALRKTLEHTPTDSADAEAETLVLITKLMMALPGQKSGEAGAEATAEAYCAALDDLPPWAVAAAVRHWYRGDAAQIGRIPHDYRWRPAPAILRALSFAEAWAVRDRAAKLEQLLTAVPLIEYSEEHKAKMLTDLSAVLHSITDGAPARTEATE